MRTISLYYCSFCRKLPDSEGCDFMFQGPEGVNICDKCADVLTATLIKKRAEVEDKDRNPLSKEAGDVGVD